MLSDEEKKAIEILGEFKKNGFHLLNLRYESRVSTTKHIENSIETILNLIEKQSKEIEELKEKNRQSKMRIVQLENEITARIEDVNQYYTPNDKIKAKIEYYEKIDNPVGKRVLESLLEKE